MPCHRTNLEVLGEEVILIRKGKVRMRKFTFRCFVYNEISGSSCRRHGCWSAEMGYLFRQYRRLAGHFQVATVQGLSGASSLRLASALIERYFPGSEVLISSPTFSGREGILSEASHLLDIGLLPNSNSATRAIGYRQVWNI
ncbi:hypothetical protein IFM89_022960 [Coptis chinensis]|uniref:Uncharacterized protein n=1 Tax=Coptis chinensis TaxID=261450 RepID=A0A835LR51_9MAGN|nr:hypothetical protein IFM89_022960 [Coptis chinensis]